MTTAFKTKLTTYLAPEQAEYIEDMLTYTEKLQKVNDAAVYNCFFAIRKYIRILMKHGKIKGTAGEDIIKSIDQMEQRYIGGINV